MKIVNIGVNLSKIEENSAKITTDKKGNKWINLTVAIMDEADNYGNDSQVNINQTKEERESKVNKVFVGSGKTVYDSDKKNAEF